MRSIDSKFMFLNLDALPQKSCLQLAWLRRGKLL
jgi:hypothetical protein